MPVLLARGMNPALRPRGHAPSVPSPPFLPPAGLSYEALSETGHFQGGVKLPGGCVSWETHNLEPLTTGSPRQAAGSRFPTAYRQRCPKSVLCRNKSNGTELHEFLSDRMKAPHIPGGFYLFKTFFLLRRCCAKRLCMPPGVVLSCSSFASISAKVIRLIFFLLEAPSLFSVVSASFFSAMSDPFAISAANCCFLSVFQVSLPEES